MFQESKFRCPPQLLPSGIKWYCSWEMEKALWLTFHNNSVSYHPFSVSRERNEEERLRQAHLLKRTMLLLSTRLDITSLFMLGKVYWHGTLPSQSGIHPATSFVLIFVKIGVRFSALYSVPRRAVQHSSHRLHSSFIGVSSSKSSPSRSITPLRTAIVKSSLSNILSPSRAT